jgi:hypothetical protein
MKFVTARPFTDPDAAARKLVEIANTAEAVQDGRIPRTGELCLQSPVQVQPLSTWLPCTSTLAARPPQATLLHPGTVPMRHYSAFQLDPTGHVAGRIDLNCIDDKDALRQAEMLADTFGLELWENDRKIAVLRKKKPN